MSKERMDPKTMLAKRERERERETHTHTHTHTETERDRERARAAVHGILYMRKNVPY